MLWLMCVYYNHANIRSTSQYWKCNGSFCSTNKSLTEILLRACSASASYTGHQEVGSCLFVAMVTAPANGGSVDTEKVKLRGKKKQQHHSFPVFFPVRPNRIL